MHSPVIRYMFNLFIGNTYLVYFDNLINKNSNLVVWITRWLSKLRVVPGFDSNRTVDEKFPFCNFACSVYINTRI